MADSDEELMRRAARGDLEAFGRLFDRHRSLLFAFLCRFMGDAATAEDVTQDVFRRVWQHRTMYDGSRRFTTWLYVIARRTALNEIKKPYRRTASLSDLSGDLRERLETPEDAPLGSNLAIRDLYLREQVREALQSLPPDQRLCMILREYEGRSHAEIAEILGCSEGNARVLAHRARAALRVLLRPLLEREGNCV